LLNWEQVLFYALKFMVKVFSLHIYFVFRREFYIHSYNSVIIYVCMYLSMNCMSKIRHKP
jgi:hypothetical protein